MNERKFEAGSLAEQIDAAKRDLAALPEQWRESAKFQGQNHNFDDVGGVPEADEDSEPEAV